MFYKIIKEFLLKKSLDKKLKRNTFPKIDFYSKVETIGILIDNSYFNKINELLQNIYQQGFSPNKVKVLCYKDKLKNKEVLEYPYYTLQDLDASGELKNNNAVQFANYPFVLLINYYDVSKPSLLTLSQQSMAKFKVGLASVDNRVNHFIINTFVENYKEFTTELFLYLRTFNKIK